MFADNLARKISRVVARHDLPLPAAMGYELFVRAYKRRWARRFLRPLFRRPTPERWIYVAGCYNSGTTVMKDLLALCPEIGGPPIEGDILTEGLSDFESGGWHRCMYGNRTLIEAVANRQIDRSMVDRDWRPWYGSRVFIDKSVSHSVRMDALRRAFPECRFVAIVRNPEDVASGILKRSMPSGEAREVLGSDGYSKQILLEQWVFINSSILESWREDDCKLVSYERLVSEPVSVVNEMFDFLEIDAVARSYDGATLTVDGVRQVRVKRAADRRAVDIHDVEGLKEVVKRIADSLPAVNL